LISSAVHAPCIGNAMTNYFSINIRCPICVFDTVCRQKTSLVFHDSVPQARTNTSTIPRQCRYYPRRRTKCKYGAMILRRYRLQWLKFGPIVYLWKSLMREARRLRSDFYDCIQTVTHLCSGMPKITSSQPQSRDFTAYVVAIATWFFM